MSTKVIFKWNESKQKVLKEIKRVLDYCNLSAYMDLNKRFEIHTNARNFQPGAVISKKFKMITLYSRKLTGPQKVIQINKRNC